MIKSGFILLLISFVLAGSTGLPVFNHFCNTSGETSTSILIPDNHCNTEQQEKSCCAEKQEKNNDCCSDQTVLYKVKFDYYQSIQLAFPPFIVPHFQSSFVFDPVVFPSIDKEEQLSFEEPDPPSGREILLHHSILRI